MTNEMTTMVLRGRVGSDLRVTQTTSGRQVARFRLAVPQWRITDDGAFQDLDAHWFTVRAWGRLAEHAAQSVRVGQPIIVIGRATANAWKDGEGEVHSELAVTAQTIGHDLAHGFSDFAKAPRVRTELTEETGTEAFASAQIDETVGAFGAGTPFPGEESVDVAGHEPAPY